MAYPTVSAPYGLKPVNLIGGQPYAGQVRSVPIASGEGTAIFFGDVVTLNSSGYLTKSAITNAGGTDAATTVLGVFQGCSYTSPTTGQKLYAQYFPAGTAASDIVGLVADDPDLVFKAAICSSGTTMGGVTQGNIGNLALLIQNSGSTATGNSAVAVDDTTATTTTYPLKVIAGVEETKNASGSYTEVLVVWNPSAHLYRNTLGI